VLAEDEFGLTINPGRHRNSCYSCLLHEDQKKAIYVMLPVSDSLCFRRISFLPPIRSSHDGEHN
jgi:hypothetical protein